MPRCLRGGDRLTGFALGGFQGVEIVFVAGPAAGSLHGKQMLQRADPYHESVEVDVGGNPKR